MADCILCQIAHREIDSTVVYEDDQVIAFEDIDPKAPVHVLIVPKQHINTLTDIKENESEILQQLLLVAKTVARLKNVEHSGYRLVVNCNPDGGQTVYHLVVHLLGGRKMNWPPG